MRILLILAICLLTGCGANSSNIKYDIGKSLGNGGGQSTYGYTINENTSENTCIVKITTGEKPSGGYSIDITDIDSDNDKNVTITVEDCSPETDDATCALTYPSRSITFYEIPNSITVIDSRGNEYPEIK